MPEFIRLTRGNDWGRIYFSQSPLDKNGTASIRRCQPVTQNQKLTIRWPDDHQEVYIIRHKTMLERIYDNGPNTITSKLPGFWLRYHDHNIWVFLDEVDVKKSELPPCGEF